MSVLRHGRSVGGATSSIEAWAGDRKTVKGDWPTPNAQISQDGEAPRTWLARREKLKAKCYNGNGAGTPLAMAVQLYRCSSIQHHLDATAAGGPAAKLCAEWVEQLMGLNRGWTRLEGRSGE